MDGNNIVKTNAGLSTDLRGSIGILEVMRIFDNYNIKARNYKSIIKNYLFWLVERQLPITLYSKSAYLNDLKERQAIKEKPSRIYSYTTPLNRIINIANDNDFLGFKIINDTDKKTLLESELDVYFEQFLSFSSGGVKSDLTKRDYRKAFKGFASFCDVRDMNKFTFETVKMYAEHLSNLVAKDTITNTTFNKYLAPLKGFAKYLILESDNIFTGLTKEKIVAIERNLNKIPLISGLSVDKNTFYKDSLTHKEVLTILEHLKSTEHRLMVALMYFTGLRSFEVLKVKHSDIDFRAKTLSIVGKGKKRATIPLEHCHTAIKSYYDDYVRNKKPDLDKPLFNAKDTATIRKFVNTALKELNLKHKKKKVSTHSFRHSLAQNLLLNGLPVELVQKIMRHEDISTTQIYFRKIQQESMLKIPENILSA